MGDFFQPTETQQGSGWKDVPGPVKDYTKSAAKFMEGRLGQAGPAWGQQFSAPMTPQEQYGLGGVEDAYRQTYGSGLQPAALSEWQRTVSGGHLPDTNPHIQAIENQMRNEANQLLGGVQQTFAQAGQGVGTPYGYLAGQIGTGLAGEVGKLRLNAYEAERSRQAAATQPGAAYTPSMAMSLMQAGALPRSLAQGELDKAYGEMQRLWDESYRAAGGAPLAQAASSGASTSESGPSPFMSLLGAAAPFFLYNFL